MTVMLFTWVFLQAILLWDIECSPIKKGFAPQYKGGYSQDPWGAQPKQQMYPSYETSGSMSGPGAQGLSPGALSSSPPEGFSGGYSSPTGSSQGSWAIPPRMFSGGPRAASDSNAGPKGQMAGPSSAPPPGPEFVPGELLNIESTMEDGRYESETQERGVAPPPSYEPAVGPAESFPILGAFMPQASLGYFYPYDAMFITGQYPPGTYTRSSSSVERGRDDWQENHYVGYDHPAEEQAQQMQSYSGQSYQPAEPEGPGKGQDVEHPFGYDYPAQAQQMQSYSRDSGQSYQPAEPEGPGKGQDVEHQFGYDYPAQAQQMQSYSRDSGQSYQPAEPEGPGKGQDVERQFQAYGGQWVG